jgi:hypothetical protein
VKLYDKIGALSVLVEEAMRPSNSIAGYRRILRVCRSLELSEAEQYRITAQLSYTRDDGKPYRWLEEKLAKGRKS